MFFPTLTIPRDRYTIFTDCVAAIHAADARGDHAEADRLHTMAVKISTQIRMTRIANRYSRR